MKKIITNEVKSAIERLNYVFAQIESYINTPEFEREGANKYLVPVSLFSTIAEWSGVSEDEVFTEILIGLNEKYNPQRIIWIGNPTKNAYCIRVKKVNDKSSDKVKKISDKVKKIYESLKKELFN